MRVLQLFLSLILTATCFGQYLKPIRGMPFVNRTHLSARGLVGWWLFNEGSGNKVFDLSGKGNTGIITGATWISGNLSFNGADWVNCGHNLSLNITSEITIIVSFKTGDTGANRSLLGKQGKGAYWLLTNADRLQFATGNLDSFSSASLTDNTWFQIATVRNNNTDKTIYYINGVYDSENSDGGNLTSYPTNDLYIGIDPRDESGLDFVGEIGYVMIYNRALTASEIALLYREPFGMMKQPNPLLYAGEVSAPPPPNGQVIMIQMSMIPLFLITAFCFMMGRSKRGI